MLIAPADKPGSCIFCSFSSFCFFFFLTFWEVGISSNGMNCDMLIFGILERSKKLHRSVVEGVETFLHTVVADIHISRHPDKWTGLGFRSATEIAILFVLIIVVVILIISVVVWHNFLLMYAHKNAPYYSTKYTYDYGIFMQTVIWPTE